MNVIGLNNYLSALNQMNYPWQKKMYYTNGFFSSISSIYSSENELIHGGSDQFVAILQNLINTPFREKDFPNEMKDAIFTSLKRSANNNFTIPQMLNVLEK